MRSINSNGSRAASARGLVALFAVLLAMGLGLMATPAAAAPFAYVTTSFDGTVSVIDTATNKVVGTPIKVGSIPVGVAVTPDGKQVYVTNSNSDSVSVIATATNTVVATIPVGNLGDFAEGIAVTPDGKHVYVANAGFDTTVSVIDTATNMVVATVPVVGGGPYGVAVTPDGKHAYVTNAISSFTVSVIDTVTNGAVATIALPVNNEPFEVAVTPDGKHAYVTTFFTVDLTGTVWVIATATNTVVATVPVGNLPAGVAVTPDGKHAYVANQNSNNVSVIDTVSNTVAATVAVGTGPFGVAVTPDGQHVYVANIGGTVSVIATATNAVEATTIPVPSGAGAIAIVPPPPGVPFLAFNAKLAIQFGSIPTKDAFGFGSNFTLSSTAPAIDPPTDPVTLQVGTFTTTIPPGSFKKQPDGSFTFQGKIHGVGLGALIRRTGTLRYLFEAKANGANLAGTVNTVYATLAIGGGSFSNSNSGATSVTAAISGTAPPVKAAMSR